MSHPAGDPARSGLKGLEAAVRHDLEVLDYPGADWVRPRRSRQGEPVLDVLLIGGGQTGLSAAFGLMREKVRNLLVVDGQSNGFEGPWLTFARMHTLRTPNHVTGPDGGLPGLTLRSWFEAQHGKAAWQNLGNIPREMWAAYLRWFRDLLKIPVRNETRAGAIVWRPADSCFAVPLTQDGVEETVLARKVVLATGIEGSGEWQIPEEIEKRLPPELYAHTHAAIDFEALRGKRVGVLGAGACAFDNAAVALETGAAEVRQFFRRPELVRVNPYRWAEFVGFLKHHADLPDAERWRFILQMLRMGQLPPAETYRRVTCHPNHFLHASSPWLSVTDSGGRAHVTTPSSEFLFDYLILGTGFRTDLSLRPELAGLHSRIALWEDRYTPPDSERHEELARHPYLGPGFEFQEKTPGIAPYVSGIFNYTFGCLPSLGLGGASISGMKYSLPRLVAGITRQLYLEDAGHYFESLCSYSTREY